MKVLLIMPCHSELIHAVSLPLGILSIGSYLKQHGHDVKICDLSIKRQSLRKICDEYKPDIAGVSYPSVKAGDGVLYVSKILRKKNIPIVWGGPFCDVALSEHLLGTGLVDILCYCEGEETWLELLDVMKHQGDILSVKGIGILKDGKVIKTEPREFLPGDKLPRLDWSLVDVPAYFQYLYCCKKLVYVYLSKGCPSHCTFCYNTETHRNKRRVRPLADFMQELSELVTVYGADGIYFADELTFLNDAELNTVCDAFDNASFHFTWGFQTRIGNLSDEAIRRAYRSGCRWIDFGIESGNKEMLQKVKKCIPYDRIEPTFAVCDDIGMISIANFIIGFPDETEAQLRDTVDLALRIKSTQNTFIKYIYGPTTPAGKQMIADNIPHPVLNTLKDYERMDFFSQKTSLSHIPQKELEVIQSHFLWNAIFRKEYGESRHYDLLLKSILIVLKGMYRMNLSCRYKAFKEIITDFASFFYYEKFDRKIHKKYGLDKS